MESRCFKISLRLLAAVGLIILLSFLGDRIYGYIHVLINDSVIYQWTILIISFLFTIAYSVLSFFEIKKFVSSKKNNLDYFFKLFLLTILFLMFFSIFRLSIKSLM